MKHLYTSIAAVLTFAFTAPVLAAPIAYATPGVQSNVQYDFVAASTGDVLAYFVGSDASYVNEIALLVNGVDTGIQGLNNKRAQYGDMLNFGAVTAGDRLVFKLVSLNPSDIGPFYSDQSLNADGYNHIYSAWYGGDNLVPAGFAVGFEDIPNGGDFDYNDENFVFVNVANATDVPEPASIALLLAGIAGLGVSRRAKRARKA